MDAVVRVADGPFATTRIARRGRGGSFPAHILGALPVGVASFAVTVVIRALAASNWRPEQMDVFAPLKLMSSWSTDDWTRFYLPGAAVLTPVYETLLFLALLKVFGRGRTAIGGLLFVLSMFIAGWVLHGSNAASLGQAVGFTFLALWCWKVAVRFGDGAAYWLTALAHGAWNASLYLFWLYGH